MEALFTNDNNVVIKLPSKHKFNDMFMRRNSHEVLFRQIHSYMIRDKLIKNNLIDLGAWIGDNTLPWAKQIAGKIYAIDPSPDNIEYIIKLSNINQIDNIITIQKPISDCNETLYTNDDINHCSFVEGKGNKQLQAVSLDYLCKTNLIENIGYIHLDVEMLEFKVIRGAYDLIFKYKPIISFEQHLDKEDYISLCSYLNSLGYNIYLINEVLPGCNYDCRNLLAFPKDNDISKKINEYFGKSVLLSVSYASEIGKIRLKIVLNSVSLKKYPLLQKLR